MRAERLRRCHEAAELLARYLPEGSLRDQLASLRDSLALSRKVVEL